MNVNTTDAFFIEGTFAAPRFYLPKDSQAYIEAQQIFKKIKWTKPLKRSNAIKNRFDAFCSILWAVTEDKDWVVYTDLNKASYSIKKSTEKKELHWREKSVMKNC